MAREHARIWLDINSDDDFERLPFDAQGFYTRVILTLDDLNYCGVASWRPKRLTTKAPDLTCDRIIACAAHLEDRRYCLFDLTTEEVLARSFIRRDELLRNPKMAAAVIKAYSGVASKVLRAAIVTEVRRVHDEHPEYSSWSSKDTADGLIRLMGYPAGVPYAPVFTDRITNPITNPITNDITNRNGNHITNPISNRITNPDHQSDSVPITDPITNDITNRIPSTYTSTPTPAPLGGYVSTEGHQGDEPDEQPPPPRYCSAHMPGGTLDKCGDCRAARQIFDRWMTTADLATKKREQEHGQAELDTLQAQRDQAAIDRAIAVANCGLCDDDGYRGSRVCDHIDRTQTTTRGRAQVQAALKHTPKTIDPPEPEADPQPTEPNPDEPPY